MGERGGEKKGERKERGRHRYQSSVKGRRGKGIPLILYHFETREKGEAEVLYYPRKEGPSQSDFAYGVTGDRKGKKRKGERGCSPLLLLLT